MRWCLAVDGMPLPATPITTAPRPKGAGTVAVGAPGATQPHRVHTTSGSARWRRRLSNRSPSMRVGHRQPINLNARGWNSEQLPE
jgi:hypothetical protein